MLPEQSNNGMLPQQPQQEPQQQGPQAQQPGSNSHDVDQAEQEARKLTIRSCINSLGHAGQCRDASCPLPSCHKMKRIVAHVKVCRRKTNGGCPICKQLIALCCYHAKLGCQKARCPVPFCAIIKIKLRQQRAHPRRIRG